MKSEHERINSVGGTILFRQATESDAKDVVNIFRGGFSGEFIAMTPLGSDHADSYYSELIREYAHGGISAITVAEQNGAIVSSVELQLSMTCIHLNYICTSSSFRVRGVGSQLLAYSVAKIKQQSHIDIQLDVLEDNRIAREWYSRLGFAMIGETIWYAIPCQGANDGDGYVTSRGRGRKLQELFGFHEVSVITQEGTYSVGILGDLWIRVTDHRILADQDARGLLERHFPDRTILLLKSDGPSLESSEGVRRIARTVRMEMKVAGLLEVLSDSRPAGRSR